MDAITIRYSNSMKQPAQGDRIVIDEKLGTLAQLLLPGTPAWKDYACEESGGVLVNYDDYGLTLGCSIL